MNKPKGYWNKENCHKEALKYKNRTEFYKNSSSAYYSSHKNNWIDEICIHMIKIGNKYKRLIYLYKFSDDYVYIGLTYNSNKRKTNHLNNEKSPVYKHMKKTSLIPEYCELTDYLPIDKAVKKEIEYISEYKKNGFKLLNKNRGGGLGSCSIKWTKEKCHKEALKYNRKIKFIKNCESAYVIAKRNKWLDDICSHMIVKRKSPPNKKWTKGKCHKEALKYKTKGEFRKKSNSVYVISCNNKWLNDICSHMIIKKQLPWNKKWTKNKCLDVVKNCKSKADLKVKNGYVYNLIYKNKWMDEFQIHFNK